MCCCCTIRHGAASVRVSLICIFCSHSTFEPLRTLCSLGNVSHYTGFLLRPREYAKYCDEYVCLSVCLSVSRISETTWPNFKFLCMLHVAIVQSSSDGIAISYVLHVLSIMSYFHTWTLQLSASRVPYHKAQYLVRDCSFSTPRTSRNTLRNTASTTTRLLTTLNCTCTVATTTHHLPSYDWRTASRKSATGCPPTV